MYDFNENVTLDQFTKDACDCKRIGYKDIHDFNENVCYKK